MLETDDCLMAGWDDTFSQGPANLLAAGLPAYAATTTNPASLAGGGGGGSAALSTQAKVRFASAAMLVVHMLMQPSRK